MELVSSASFGWYSTWFKASSKTFNVLKLLPDVSTIKKSCLFLKYFNNKNLKIISKLLDKEIGDVKDIESGTYTHSLERIFGYIISAEGMRIVDNSNI